MKKLLDSKVYMVGVLLIYKLLLDYIYKEITSISYAYYGFVSQGDSFGLLFSWGLFAFFTYMMVQQWNRINDFTFSVLFILYLIRLVPTTTIIANVPQPNGYLFAIFVFWLLIFIFSFFFHYPGYKPLIRKAKGNSNILLFTTIFLSLIVLLVSGVYAHFRISFDLLDVYGLREEARGFDMPLVLVYFWAASAYVLPILFVYYLTKRNTIICFLLAFVILLNFSIDGSKSIIFSLFLFLFLHFLYNSYIIKSFPVLLIVALLVAIFENLVFDSGIVHHVLIRRVFFVPSFLDTLYYDFYTNHLSMIEKGNMPIEFLLSDYYWGNSDMRANNGLYSDSLVNYGAFGFIIFPIIIMIYVNLCNKYFQYAEKEILVATAIIFAFTLQSSALTTALATHGLFLLSVIIYFISSNNYLNKNTWKSKDDMS